MLSTHLGKQDGQNYHYDDGDDDDDEEADDEDDEDDEGLIHHMFRWQIGVKVPMKKDKQVPTIWFQEHLKLNSFLTRMQENRNSTEKVKMELFSH